MGAPSQSSDFSIFFSVILSSSRSRVWGNGARPICRNYHFSRKDIEHLPGALRVARCSRATWKMRRQSDSRTHSAAAHTCGPRGHHGHPISHRFILSADLKRLRRIRGSFHILKHDFVSKKVTILEWTHNDHRQIITFPWHDTHWWHDMTTQRRRGNDRCLQHCAVPFTISQLSSSWRWRSDWGFQQQRWNFMVSALGYHMIWYDRIISLSLEVSLVYSFILPHIALDLLYIVLYLLYNSSNCWRWLWMVHGLWIWIFIEWFWPRVPRLDELLQ